MYKQKFTECDIYLALPSQPQRTHQDRPYTNSGFGWFGCTDVNRPLLTFAVQCEFNGICQDLPEGGAVEQLWLIAIECNRESTVTVKIQYHVFLGRNVRFFSRLLRPHPARPVTLRLLPWLSLLGPYALTLSFPLVCASFSSFSFSLPLQNISPPWCRRSNTSLFLMASLHSVQSPLAKLRFIWCSSESLKTPLSVIAPVALSSFPKSLVWSHFFFISYLTLKRASGCQRRPWSLK